MQKLAFLIISLLVFPCFAIHIDNLYSSSVVVASQNDSDRTQAVQNALKQVLIKVSGDADVINAPAIQTGIQNANNYLQTYTYQTGTNFTGQPALFLNAQFDGKVIKSLLHKSQQPVWGSNRPLILVWLVLSKNQTTPVIVNAANTDLSKNFLIKAAEIRGLPLEWPMLDLTDQQLISVNDIIQANADKIMTASKRYNSDDILIVNLQQSADNQWQCHWQLVSTQNQDFQNQGQQTSWYTSGADLQTVMTTGINNITNSLAARYSVVASNTATSDNVELTIINIQNLANYADVNNYLKSLSPVKNLEVAQINATTIVYDLEIVGGKQALQQALSLDHRLQAIDNSNNSSGANTDQTQNQDNAGLVYRWNS